MLMFFPNYHELKSSKQCVETNIIYSTSLLASSLFATTVSPASSAVLVLLSCLVSCPCSPLLPCQLSLFSSPALSAVLVLLSCLLSCPCSPLLPCQLSLFASPALIAVVVHTSCS
eukprot:Selendium_serpulae@DN6470_c1_g1_i9.p2